MKYDLRKPTVWAVKLGIRVGIFMHANRKSHRKNSKEKETLTESCSNFKNYMERKKEEQK